MQTPYGYTSVWGKITGRKQGRRQKGEGSIFPREEVRVKEIALHVMSDVRYPYTLPCSRKRSWVRERKRCSVVKKINIKHKLKII